MKNITLKPAFLLCFWIFGLCFSFSAQASVSPNSELPREQAQQMSKKKMRQQIKTFRQTHKSTMKVMKAKERRAYIQDGIQSEQFVAGAWFPIGLALVIIGALLGLLFAAPIAWFGLGIAVVGLGFLVVWIIREINREW